MTRVEQVEASLGLDEETAAVAVAPVESLGPVP